MSSRRRQPTTTGALRRLLVVDFDYFFPNPLENGIATSDDWMLYDWGHNEDHPVEMMDFLWKQRASAFFAAGRDLPRCEGWENFWDRFTARPEAPLFVSDSNADTGGFLPPTGHGEATSAWAEIHLYDAHHDAGYQHTYTEYLTSGTYNCEDWTYPHYQRGTKIHMRYPQWRSNFDALEPQPSIKLASRRLDDGRQVDKQFDAVFLCRSGHWVPPWCDDQFFAFSGLYPFGFVREADEIQGEGRWSDQHIADARLLAEKTKTALAAMWEEAQR